MRARPVPAAGGLSRRRALAGLVLLPAALGAVALSPIARAHRARVSLTRLLANPAADTWEFVTTLHLHDASVALRRLGAAVPSDPASPQGQARLALEVERTMLWYAPDAAALRPTVEGSEILGNDLVIYQSLPRPQASGEYAVESRLLHAVYPDMANSVQIDVVDPPRLERLTSARPRAVFEWSPVSASPR
jgi:hypothetical protein